MQNFAARHRLLAAFIFILSGVILIDEIFYHVFYEEYLIYIEQLGNPAHAVADVDMNFAPEVWLVLLKYSQID